MSDAVKEADGFYLNPEDRLWLVNLKKQVDRLSGLTDPTEISGDGPVIVRCKKGTTIPGIDPETYEPGKGIGIKWTCRAIVEDDEAVFEMKKLSRGTDPLGQSFTYDSANDIELNIYNFTPFEVFDNVWFEVRPAPKGMYVVANPPLAQFVAKKLNGDDIEPGEGALMDIGYKDPTVTAAATAADIIWLTDESDSNIQRVCWHVGPGVIERPTGTIMIVQLDAGGSLIINTVFCEEP